MVFTRLAAAGALAALAAAVPAAAQDTDPIATRQALMEQVGEAGGAANAMVRGEADYDALAARLAMRTIFAAATAFPHYFPEGSESGGDTEAAPAIWENRQDFDGHARAMAEDAAAAIAPAGEGVDSLRAAFGEVAANCRACHETYRID